MSRTDNAQVLPAQIDWPPTADMAAIRARAKMLARCRDFFAARGVLEVETPVLAKAGTTDPNIESLQLDHSDGGGMYLNTSPEFAMKRLLAAGSGDIYQICKAFRAGELGKLHNPEFSLLEWYRQKFGLMDLMQEVAVLLASLLERPDLVKDAEYVSYKQIFEQCINLNPFAVDESALSSCLRRRRVPAPGGELGRDALLDLIMSAVVLPMLDPSRLWFIYDYPISQAALARPHPDNPLLARRFEAVFAGIELANGFEELADHREQRARFVRDCRRRAETGAKAMPMDENLLAALAHGIGDYAGVALGLDRVLMLARSATHIDEVLCFPVSRA